MFPQTINEYMVAHPEMVLGTHTSTGTMRAANQYNVEPSGDLETQLAAAIMQLPENVIDITPPEESLEAFRNEQPPLGTRPYEDPIHEGRLAQVVDGKITPVTLASKADVARVKDLLPIREAIRELYDLMAQEGPDEGAPRLSQRQPMSHEDKIIAAREHLNKVYDAFVKKHGYISAPDNWRAFREDPDMPLLLSLEDYDDETEKAAKTAVFTQRTMRAERAARRANSPEHALQLTLGERGRIDIPRIAELLGLTPDEATIRLQDEGLILDTPGGWDIPGRYLAGNVRVRYREAQAAAELDPRYKLAADALKQAIPADIPAHKINVRLGANWIPPETVTDFLKSITNSDLADWSVTYSPQASVWSIAGNGNRYAMKYSTGEVDGRTMVLTALNDKRLTIRGVDPVTKARVVDATATALARARRDQLYADFSKWLFNEDADRRKWAVEAYNERFNTYVQPQIDGKYLTFPGMADYWRDRISPHQRNAIARALQLGNILLAHVVGAGKTLTMVAQGMEMRRLGLARKPLYVIPNHLIAQFPSDFLQYYPNAKLLVASPEDLNKENRKRFTGRIASGDWDGVVMPYSAFVRVSMSKEAETAYQRELLDDVDAAILQAWIDSEREQSGTTKLKSRDKRKAPPSVKQLEKVRDTIQKKLDELAARPKDDMLDFEHLGVDALLVDEAHSFKNLYFPTRQQAAGIPNATLVQRATDMYLKTRYINKLSNYRNVTFATGTPVSNSMAEIFVMQKLLQEEALIRAGIGQFDAWLAQFGSIVIAPELDPSGTGISARPRLVSFRNLPDLAAMFRQVADVKMIDDLPELKKARPRLRGDAIEAVVIPMTPFQQAFLESLKHRADHLDPRDRVTDNMPKITTDGRLSSLDMRLIDRRNPDEPGNKLHRVAQEVAGIYKEWNDRKGTQLIFMDQGVPGSSKKSTAQRKVIDRVTGIQSLRPPTEAEAHRGYELYEDLKLKLIAAGVPRDQIAFIHDIDKVPEKKQNAARKILFRKVNDGSIRVLIGSRSRMATGMNVQKRLVASHNVDPVWKPSDMEQANGRILRQGNDFFKADPEGFRVRILNYITEGVGLAFGFDAYMWNLNEAKANIIARFFSGDLTERDLELDLEQSAINAATFKAIATGNPLMVEEGKVRADLMRLEMVREGWNEDRRSAQWNIGAARDGLKNNNESIARNQRVIDASTPTPDPFAATIGDKTVEGHKAVGTAILELAQKDSEATAKHPGEAKWTFKPATVGTFRGLNISFEKLGTKEIHVVLRHPDDKTVRQYGMLEDKGEFSAQKVDLFSPDPAGPGGIAWRDPTGLARALDNAVDSFAQTQKWFKEWAQDYATKIKNYQRAILGAVRAAGGIRQGGRAAERNRAGARADRQSAGHRQRPGRHQLRGSGRR